MAVVATPTPSKQEELSRRGRVDGYPKVTGRARYTGDLAFPGMLYGAVVRSPYPHARIRRIHTEAAARLPGVHAVLTGDDIPDRTFGRWVYDIPALARGVVRYAGERVAAVAAETPQLAEEAAALIEVEYDPLPAVLDPAEALAPGAPLVHEKPWTYPNAVVTSEEHPNVQSRVVWQHGDDVEKALAASHRVFERTYRLASVHQGYLEPHVCVARVDGDRIDVWAPNKSPYRLRTQLADWLGVAEENIHVHPVPIGGDFGGKGSPMDVPLCILLARHTGRAVRMEMRYAEELLSGNPRHPATITVRLGVDEHRRLTALDVKALVDGGAYAGYKPVPNSNLSGMAEAGNCYRIPAVRIESVITYTHTVPKGNMRSPGSVQANFAVESLIDEAARQLGLDPIEFRRLNMLRTGDRGTLGEEWVEFRSEETLQALLDAASASPLPPPEPESDWARGVGISFYSRSTHGRTTEVALQPHDDGSLTLWVPFPDQGGGQFTFARQAVQERLPIPSERLHVRQADPAMLSFDPGVGGSRVTVDGALAIHQAVDKLLERLREEGLLPSEQKGEKRLTPASLSEAIAALARRGCPPIKGQGNNAHLPPITSVCMHLARVRVDRRTGQLVVDDIITALDVAHILNPASHLVQVEGGILMGYGQGVMEDLLVQDGRPTAGNLGEYKLPTMRDAPRLTVILVPNGKGAGPYNIKAIGELTNVAVPAAIANAVADAVGVRIDSLPITAEKIYSALQERERVS